MPSKPRDVLAPLPQCSSASAPLVARAANMLFSKRPHALATQIIPTDIALARRLVVWMIVAA